MSESDSRSESELEMIKFWNEGYRRLARINKSELACILSETLDDIHYTFKRQHEIGKYIIRLILTVINISQHFKTLLMDEKHKLKKLEAIKIEAIAGLSDNLKTLVKTLIKSGELKFEGREKILKIVKPLLWLTRFTDSKLHVDLMDYEKRKKRRGTGRRRRLRDPNELLILYSERSFTILMESEGRVLEEKEAPK